MCTNKAQRGISLIELVLFIVIIGIALAALLSVLNVTTQNSVDPLLRKQALTIAESLLEEVQLHDFSNPAGGFTGAATQTNRASFDDVMDYNGFATTGIYSADGSGTVITGLSDYNVSVTVVPITWLAVASDAVQITVTVTPPNGQSLQTIGYRMNH
jgi:MSHA pilin protein MshD